MNVAESRDTEKVNMIVTLAIWCVLCSLCMAAMLVMASRKTIIIADTGQEPAEIVVSKEEKIIPSGALLLQEDEKAERQISIPLGEGIKAENVVVENRYMAEELWIYIQNTSHVFYDVNALSGDVSYIENGWYEAGDEAIILKMQMSDLLEYRSTLENGRLRIQFFEPKELYKQIVVIDPAEGSESLAESYSSAELTCQVAKLLQKKVTQPEIKLYFTRLEAEEISEEQKQRLVEETGADLFLEIGVSKSENPDIYGIQSFYNEEYYIPDFGNVQWADIVTRNVTISASNRAIGLYRAEDDSILRKLEIPAAQINVGFVSNSQESALLQQETYQEKIAGGIAQAILEVYTDKNKFSKQAVNNEE